MISIAQKMARLADFFSGNQNGAGLPLSNRNYIVDGNFEQWSATSTTMAVASAGYSPAVMYYAYTGDSPGQATLSQVDLTTTSGLGGLTTPYRWAHRWQQTAASTNVYPYMYQLVEGVRTLQGRSATFSCWLWSNTGSNITIPSVLAQQYFGSGGSPSADVLADKAVNWVVTPTPQRFSVRIDFPSIAGKTLGTNGNDCIRVGLYLPKGVTFDLLSTQWQLEQSSPQTSSDTSGAGGLPTAFEYRGLAQELVRVQRFYEVSYDSVTSFNGSFQSIAGSPYLLQNGTVAYKVAKRRAPTVIMYSPHSGSANLATELTTGSVYNAERSVIVQNIGTAAFNFYISAGTATTGNNIFAHWSADARY